MIRLCSLYGFQLDSDSKVAVWSRIDSFLCVVMIAKPGTTRNGMILWYNNQYQKPDGS